MFNDTIFGFWQWIAFTAVVTAIIFLAGVIVFIGYTLLVRFAIRQIRGKGLHKHAIPSTHR